MRHTTESAAMAHTLGVHFEPAKERWLMGWGILSETAWMAVIYSP